MIEPTPSELARALAAQRKRVMKRCEVCDREFEGLTKSRFCSNACKVRDYRERNRDGLNAKRRTAVAVRLNDRGTI